jgi:pyridoxine/pyridoxamine 5'-phosphate oxidase
MSPPWLKAFRTSIERVQVPIVLSLATVDRNGDPRVRSVICRRVDDEGGLWFTSDARSAKNLELAAHPRVAACCLLMDEGLQFQFTGEAKVDRNYDRRQAVWASLKGKSRGAFFGPDPGAERAHADHFVQSSDEEETPDTFSLIILRPSQVELLDVRPTPNLRWRWVDQSGWYIRELNP